MQCVSKGSYSNENVETLVQSKADAEKGEQCHSISNERSTTNSIHTVCKLPQVKPSCNFINITVSRVSLHDPIMMHNHNWKYTVLPRLRSFVNAVYSIRRDDEKRYKLLVALSGTDDKAPWEILHSECAWLRECDTAFCRL